MLARGDRADQARASEVLQLSWQLSPRSHARQPIWRPRGLLGRSNATQSPDRAVRPATAAIAAVEVDRVGEDTRDQTTHHVAHIAPEPIDADRGARATGVTASEIAAISVG